MTTTTSRIVGVDVARCLALLGMMATHVLAPVTASGAMSTSHEIASGRASGLFALLAGVSLALVTGGSTPHRGRRLLGERAGIVVRAVLIGLIGLLLGALPTNIAIILVYYAVLFVMALPFLGLGWRPLAVLALVWSVAGPAVSLVLRADLSSPARLVPSFEDLAAPGELAQSLLLTGYYPAISWFAYLLAGLAIGRLDLRRPAIAARVALTGTVVAAVTWVVSADLTRDAAVRRALLSTDGGGATTWSQLRQQLDLASYGTTPTGSWWWLVPIGPHAGTPFTLLHTIGCAMAVLGLAVLASRALRTGLGGRLRGGRDDAHALLAAHRDAHSRCPPAGGPVELPAPGGRGAPRRGGVRPGPAPWTAGVPGRPRQPGGGEEGPGSRLAQLPAVPSAGPGRTPPTTVGACAR